MSLFRLTELRYEVLKSIAEACLSGEGCKGGCDLGWYEGFTHDRLRAANELAKADLVEVANGANPRNTAFHVNEKGRAVLAGMDTKWLRELLVCRERAEQAFRLSKDERDLLVQALTNVAPADALNKRTGDEEEHDYWNRISNDRIVLENLLKRLRESSMIG